VYFHIFLFNDPPPTGIYTLSLHDALPISVFLFIPSHAFKRVGEWGLSGLMERMGGDWRTFVNRALDPSDPWLIVQHHEGPDAVKDAFQLVLSGAADARSGHMLLL